MKEKACNIFCDASIDNAHHIACAGALFINEDCNKILSEYRVRQLQATNNSAEILAILTGLRAALSVRELCGYNKFNLFSDSKLSIFGLREWLTNWVYNQQLATGYFIGSNGQPVKNQDYFKECVRLVVDKQLDVNLFHQNGHMTYNNPKHLKTAYNTFVKSNNITPEATGVDIIHVCYFNDMVDNRTREAIQDNSVPLEYKTPMMYQITESDLYKFKQLTKLRYK